MRNVARPGLVLLLLATLPGTREPPTAGAADTALAGGLGGLLERPTWREDTVNLVKNHSFEETDEAGHAVGWRGFRSAQVSVTDREARTGRRSLEIRDSNVERRATLVLQALDLAPGWYTLSAWVKADGVGEPAVQQARAEKADGRRRAPRPTSPRLGPGARISVRGDGTGGSTGLVHGTTGWTRVALDVFAATAGTEATVRLEAYKRPAGVILFDDVAVRRLRPPPLEAFLLHPNYRGALLEGGPAQVRVRVAVHPEGVGASLPDVVVRAALRREGEAAAVVQTEKAAEAGPFEVALDASKLPAGAYVLQVEAARRSGPVLYRHPGYRIVRPDRGAGDRLRTWVDEDNALVLGGRRRFALGIYDTTGYSNRPEGYEKRLADIAEAPFDLYLNYWLNGAPVEAVQALLDALQHRGMFYLHTCNGWYRSHKRWPGRRTCEGRTADDLGEEGFTACMARTLGRHPALAGWYTADERPAEEAGRVFEQYRVLRAHDPDGVAFVAQNDVRDMPWWRDAADVVDLHRYPIVGVPEGAASPLERVLETTATAAEAMHGRRPVWTVIQWFQHGSKGHVPTYDELRSMSYLAIAGGAKGLLYWSYGAKGLSWVKDEKRRAAQWAGLVRLTKEIKSIEPALLAADAPDVLRAWPPELRVLARRAGGRRYIIAVNPTPRPVEAEFALAEPAADVEVVEEGRRLPAREGRFADAFAGYGVHVYRTGAAPSGGGR